MIFDKLEKLRQYDVVSDKVLNFLFNLDENKPAGHYEIDDEAYANIDVYETKEYAICFPEAHKRYIDIQMLLSGEERLDLANISELSIKDDYDEERDIMFFHNPEKMNTLYLKKGYFALLYPTDAHKPQIKSSENSQTVKKVVVKIAVKKYD